MNTHSLQSSCSDVVKVSFAAWGLASAASDHTSVSPSAKGASKAAPLSDAAPRAIYRRDLTEILEGIKHMRAIALRDSSRGSTAEFAYDFAYADYTDGGRVGGLLDRSGTAPSGDGILRYASGESVTEESQTYFNREERRYRRERIALYESEVRQGTLVGEIINKLYDLQDQQPARFRAMNMWLIDADFPRQ